jgi:hypothetical protein
LIDFANHHTFDWVNPKLAHKCSHALASDKLPDDLSTLRLFENWHHSLSRPHTELTALARASAVHDIGVWDNGEHWTIRGKTTVQLVSGAL